MNTIKTALLACLLASATVPAFASVVLTLDFEDAPGAATLVNNRYATLGATFSAGAYVVASRAAVTGGTGAFYGTVGNVDPLSNKGAVLLTSDPTSIPSGQPASFIVNLSGGFNAVSLDFAGLGQATLTALDKNGKALGSASANDLALCNRGTFACNWAVLSLDLGGVEAFSLQISGLDGDQWIDNMAFTSSGTTTPPGNVPEPGGVALSLAALGALAWTRKRITTGHRG